MKRINQLIKKAKKLSKIVFEITFPENDDGFLEALGVNPDNYEVRHKNEVVGYDYMRALRDTVKVVWDNEEERMPEI